MTRRELRFCDNGRECWEAEHEFEPDDPGWVVIDGNDYCPHCAPCPTCGHANRKHSIEEEDSGHRTCHYGTEYDWAIKIPGRSTSFDGEKPGKVLDWLVEGPRLVIAAGCGCRALS